MNHQDNPSTGRQRLLMTLERLLSIQALDLKGALDQASQLVGEALGADKVDVFLHDPTIESLVAEGTSDTPMARLQQRLGLTRVPVANGGYSVDVFQSGESYRTGQADQDPSVPVGIHQSLGVRSIMSVPLPVGADRRGTLEVVSSRQDNFTEEDLRFLQAVAQWVGMVAHRAELIEQVTNEAGVQARQLAADELIAVLAHDLRTPLTAARGYADLLRRRLEREGREDDVNYARQIDTALRRLGGMIGDLLDAGRLEQGLFALSLQPVDLGRLIRETAGMLEMPETPIQVEASEDVVARQADPDRLRQALENLLSNALRHGPPGAPIVVRLDQETRDDGEWGIVTVRDHGPGIAATLLPTLFDRFARDPASTGLGLGLFLARGIAEEHGGTLTVESKIGEGSTFRLALPLGGKVGRGPTK
jgi:two-component system, OmpR family, sensor kinase